MILAVPGDQAVVGQVGGGGLANLVCQEAGLDGEQHAGVASRLGLEISPGT